MKTNANDATIRVAKVVLGSKAVSRFPGRFRVMDCSLVRSFNLMFLTSEFRRDCLLNRVVLCFVGDTRDDLFNDRRRINQVGLVNIG